MKLNDELMFLERGVVTKDELKAHYKVEAMMAIKEDNYDDAAVYLNEVKKLVAPSATPQDNSSERIIRSNDIKSVISMIKSKANYDGHQLTIDEVIDVIDTSLKDNQKIRDLVQDVFNGKY